MENDFTSAAVRLRPSPGARSSRVESSADPWWRLLELFVSSSPDVIDVYHKYSIVSCFSSAVNYVSVCDANSYSYSCLLRRSAWWQFFLASSAWWDWSWFETTVETLFECEVSPLMQFYEDRSCLSYIIFSSNYDFLWSVVVEEPVGNRSEIFWEH